jgi:hypothetical protein
MRTGGANRSDSQAGGVRLESLGLVSFAPEASAAETLSLLGSSFRASSDGTFLRTTVFFFVKLFRWARDTPSTELDESLRLAAYSFWSSFSEDLVLGSLYDRFSCSFAEDADIFLNYASSKKLNKLRRSSSEISKCEIKQILTFFQATFPVSTTLLHLPTVHNDTFAGSNFRKKSVDQS